MRHFLIWLLLLPSLATANLQICPRMPVQAAVTNNFLTAISAAGAVTTARPACATLSDAATSCSTDTTVATNISSGTLPAGRMPALTGDITTSAGAVATTLATVNSNVGTFGSSTQVAQVTVNGKGLVTAAANVTIAATVVTAPPAVQNFLSGSGTYNKDYTFVITSGSATVGATYTNNSITYTVYATVASATQVVMSGSGAPTASGTLTKASGTGDSTLTFSQVLAPLYLHVEMVGAGSGGGGGGSGGGNSTAGGNTTFGSSLLVANGGGVANGSATSACTPGTASLGTGPVGTAVSGAPGGFGGLTLTNSTVDLMGAPGASTPFGGGGGGSGGTATAGAAPVNSGAGGGAGGSAASGATNNRPGASGCAGGYVDAIITSPAATYAYAVGASGAGGSAGTNGGAGGASGSGRLRITENFQ